ncbi:MAG: hypothetical protein CL678_08470 [Bdellovibrionaceae bacterium]|nr:hypothetical protein [Pseudobdellovibrionaceae bacterium]|tara:strand:- start:184 stop:1200 length:1017 start_codon:yes stop_codon:yes gene_type:complete
MSTATEIDKVSIESMSFCPTAEQIARLIAQSIIAEEYRDFLQKGNWWRKKEQPNPKAYAKLLSKLVQLPGEFGLCPDSLNPNDTILAKLGRGEKSGGIGPGGLGDRCLKIINDRNMPLGSTSCGPNGVVTQSEGRMNLFHQNQETTRSLLEDYISFRDKNLNAIFEMFVKKIESSAETMKLDPEKEATLEGKLQPDYRNVKDMFNLVLQNRGNKNLSDCGIGCVSFCQTWLRNNFDVGDAQFSVMSPHFQTRFYVSDDANLKSCGVTPDQIASYVTIINNFNKIMSQDYGIGGGGQAFVNLDDLKNYFSRLRGGGKNKKTKKGKKNRSSKKKRKTNKK